MNLDFPYIEIFHVTPDGAISLVSAGEPYSNLQWTRSFSGCGSFAITLNCDLPFSWPGRYMLVISGRKEIGIVEKVSVSERSRQSTPVIEGRFFESFLDRWKFGPKGASLNGANWRQVVSRALTGWVTKDVPPLAAGEGIASSNGSSYSISGDAGDSPMEIVYSCTSGNGAYPLYTYDRGTDAKNVYYNIISGVNRLRSQSVNPWWVFSLDLASISSIEYVGDYSPACSQVLAYAYKEVDEQEIAIERIVPVPGFDPNTMWTAQAFEDVTSLVGQDNTPTNTLVDDGGRLRAHNHQPAIAVDTVVSLTGYMNEWDLGDLCEVEIPALGIVAQERVEEVREIWKYDGHHLEATLGTKLLTRLERALQGRR